MKILIADDDAATRLILKKKAEAWGYEVALASDGTEAMEILSKSKHPRIAILDWMMPGMDGIDICRRLAETENARLTYTILLTSKDSKADMITALENGAHDFISKPPNPDELRCRLKTGQRLVAAEDKILVYAEQMKELSITDPLTGVKNRRHFLEHAQEEFQRSQRYKHPMTIAMLDIDKFKKVNDEYGHDTGDQALKFVTGISLESIRDTDHFARFGGEEFILMMPETDIKNGFKIADRVRQSLQDSALALESGKELSITLSIGVATLVDGDENIETIIKRADDALYQAKESGRNRVIAQETPESDWI